MQLPDLLERARDQGASDLHLASGLAPRLRVHGQLDAIPGLSALSDEALRSLLSGIVSEQQWRHFEEDGDLDFGYSLPGVARFRANYFRQDRGAAAVFRRIPDVIAPLEDLGLPPVVETLADLERGLVLVTGPTGSGKSTTLASLVDLINRRYAKHIVTIEDPVEFVHPNHRSILTQREVGTDTGSFAEALRSAMRQDADVVLVGELRDLETISLALTAAEMGSLVLGTLHTNSAPKTIDRIIDVFPAKEQQQIRLALGDSLAAVVAQTLVPNADGTGRHPATEVLLRCRGLGNAIREQATPMIVNLIQGGKAVGMRTMDDSLVELYKQGKTSFDEAYRKATDKDRFERLAGV
jgi:twitching motility protein PilT